MLYSKKVSVKGAFAKKGIDVKDGDTITIMNEGQQVTGQFGPQDVFLFRLTNGEEKNLSLNTTSLNNCVDAFGEDSANWVGQQVRVYMIRSNVQGKIIPVLYVAHPQAHLDDDGQFSLNKATQQNSDGSVNGFVNTEKKAGEHEITLDEIPF